MQESYKSIPSAHLLLSSLRSVGYTPETAVADILDNCLSAKATIVKIYFDWTDQCIMISDNGSGMTKTELLESMAIGSSDPDSVRDVLDLGRFGMGMKTASFSLGRQLTVLTKNRGECNNACWDLDYVKEKDDWEILVKDDEDKLINKMAGCINQLENGTIVCISKIDKLISTKSDAEKKKFYKMIDNIKAHLSLVFHRFMESGEVSIFVNDSKLTFWNPFIPDNNACQELEQEEILENGHRVIIKPYVLPHRTKFVNDDAFNVAGGYKGWLQHQGFYVYRNRRLIIFGTWFGLFKKETTYNLARIQLDIYSDSDFDWQIDIKKSKAIPPIYAFKAIRLSAENAVKRSIRVYNSRGTYSGRKGNTSVPRLSYVWEQRKDSRGAYSFYLNKKHTLLNQLKISLNSEQKNILNTYLNLVEKCSPMVLSGVNDTVSIPKEKIDTTEYNKLYYQAKQMIETLYKNNYIKEEIRGLFQQLADYSIFIDVFDNMFEEVCNESE